MSSDAESCNHPRSRSPMTLEPLDRIATQLCTDVKRELCLAEEELQLLDSIRLHAIEGDDKGAIGGLENNIGSTLQIQIDRMNAEFRSLANNLQGKGLALGHVGSGSELAEYSPLRRPSTGERDRDGDRTTPPFAPNVSSCTSPLPTAGQGTPRGQSTTNPVGTPPPPFSPNIPKNSPNAASQGSKDPTNQAQLSGTGSSTPGAKASCKGFGLPSRLKAKKAEKKQCSLLGCSIDGNATNQKGSSSAMKRLSAGDGEDISAASLSSLHLLPLELQYILEGYTLGDVTYT